jgi:hypothetical protein
MIVETALEMVLAGMFILCLVWAASEIMPIDPLTQPEAQPTAQNFRAAGGTRQTR